MDSETSNNDVGGSIEADVISLIAKQRLLRLVEGGCFLKYSPKGQRIKDKYWCCKLSPNHSALYYGDVEDVNKIPQFDELPNKINISDIKKLIIGKDCPHTKDGHMKKSSIDSAFSILYVSEPEDYLNFVAKDHKIFCYWIDGINSLLNSNMDSEEFQKDYQILLKVESMMRSMNKI